MLVPGDIAAMCADWTMNAPALAALPPGGIQTATGTCDESIDWTIPRMASTSPPGVSSWKMRSESPLSVDCRIVSRTNSYI